MPFSKENTYTTDYIYSLPEGQRAELIDGVIYDMAPPNRLHQELVMNLSAEIREYISKNNGFCKVYPAHDLLPDYQPVYYHLLKD